jgi:hypothetical protein
MFQRFVAVLVVILFAVFPLYAALTGDIEGTVFDPTGAVVPQAKVMITNLANGTQRTIMTSASGQFAALQLELGSYEVKVEKSGMRTLEQRVTVRSNEKTRIDASLQIGSSTEVVEVAGEAAPALDLATSQVSSSLDTAMAVSLPNQGRNPVAFATLSPGTVPVSKDNPFLGAGSFNSNGSRGRSNNITVDNAVASDISTTGSSGVGTFSLDSIQEVNTITNNFSAEYGRNSGAQVQIITKSGTNGYHGTAYWFHQNSFFNGRDYFDTTGSPTPLIENVYGFEAGGPVIRNRMFLYGHYEGKKIRGAGSSSSAVVLTPAQAAGIADPTSLALFQNNQVPTSTSGATNAAAPNKTDAHSWSLRWDGKLRGGRDTATVRYGENPVQVVDPGLTFVASNLLNYGASNAYTDRTTFIGYSSTLSSTMVNQLRFQFLRSNPGFPPFTTLKAPYPPEVQISGFDNFGESNIIPQGRTQNVYTYSDTFSWARGHHSLKFGGDAYRYLAPSVFDANFRGTVVFGSLGDFQAGNPLQWTQRFGTSIRHNKSLDFGFFAQDDYRVTQTLTLNLGFRMESSGGVSEANNLLSNLNPNLNTPLGGGGTGPLGSLQLGGDAFARTWNPGPRVGFSWNPNRGKLVVRGGYGLAYDFLFLNPITNLRFSAPFVPSITVTSFTGTNTLANLVAGTAQAQNDARAAIGSFLATQANFGTISPVDQHLKNPRNQQWSGGVEYELQHDFVLKATYVGSKNDRLQATIPMNLVNPSAIPAPATSDTDEAARLAALRGAFLAETGNASGSVVNNRLDHRFNTANQVKSVAHSNYNSMQLDLVKRYRHGVGFNLNYTYSHSIDDVSDSLGVLINDSAGLQDPRNLALNRGNSEFDIRHRLVGSYLLDVPYTHGLTGVAGKVLGGWKLSGTIDLHSGLPVSILAGSRRGVNDLGLVGNSTVRASGDPTKLHPVPLPASGISPFPSACARGVNTSTSAAKLCPNTSGFPVFQPLLGNFGNSGRNVLRLDGMSNVDMAIMKDTRATEHLNVQFRWEVYNLFNTANFAVLNNTLTSGFFGTYTSTATDQRQMQGSIKFVF